jgi:hypothetical protein
MKFQDLAMKSRCRIAALCVFSVLWVILIPGLMWQWEGFPMNPMVYAKMTHISSKFEKYISFETCGGITNQRLALVHGLMLANLTSRHVILPRMNMNGLQDPENDYQEDRNTGIVDLDQIYDLEHLKSTLMNTVRFSESSPMGPVREYSAKDAMMKASGWTTRSANATRDLGPDNIIKLDCTLFSLSIQGDANLESLFWRVDSAIRPSSFGRAVSNIMTERLRFRSLSLGANGDFNALHVRIGEDWSSHCRRWETKEQDNCMTNSDILAKVLSIEGVPTNVPLYLILETPLASANGSVITDELKRKFDLVSKEMLWPHEKYDLPQNSRSRELRASIDYEIASAAKTFIGNSVSTFSALQLLSRKMHPMIDGPDRSFHYNGGSIPLAGRLFDTKSIKIKSTIRKFSCYVARNPRVFAYFCGSDALKCAWGKISKHYASENSKQDDRELSCDPKKTVATMTLEAPPIRKWVFTINTDVTTYDEMIKVAVLSAKKFTSLIPVAVASGKNSQDAPIVKWLLCKGARVIFHNPQWAEAVRNGQQQALKLGLHEKASPLYGDWQKMVATFLRLDLAVLGFVDDYILYADVDIVFNGEVANTHFGTMMPKYFTLGVEDIRNGKDGNMGIMLINVRSMRERYEELVKWTFSEEQQANGLFYGQPCDQGALKSFFKDSFQVIHSSLFNWKPYWGFNPFAPLVHFHGPKPGDYMEFFNHGGGPAIYEKLFGKCKNASNCLSNIQLYTNWTRQDLQAC